MEINLDYAKARRLLLPAFDKLTLALIGCGGTGSWLAPAVVRVGLVLKERYDKNVQIVFVDPDRVEEKNVYRQNFCQAEIGHNKADTLAFRLGLVWGMEIRAVQEKFSAAAIPESGQVTVLIGCVDNGEARREIETVARASWKNAWWLDSGNEKNSGQVLVGRGSSMPKDVLDLPGFCSWLPLPSQQHPELLESSEGFRPVDSGMSCAEMALADSQGLAINQRMAAEMADYLVRMLVTKDLRKYATYIDLESGVCRSSYITDKMVKGWGKK